MIVLAGGDLVLPNHIIPNGSLVIDGGDISALVSTPFVDSSGARVIDVRDTYVVPGFVDVHVHGVEGLDTLDGGAVGSIAARLPRYGVTAFCPTTVACDPQMLGGVLCEIQQLRAQSPGTRARVLPAHLESNFINPEYKGAQPAACLRQPLGARSSADRTDGTFSTADILHAIAIARSEVGIVTLAPELPGAIDLIRDLVSAGHRV